MHLWEDVKSFIGFNEEVPKKRDDERFVKKSERGNIIQLAETERRLPAIQNDIAAEIVIFEAQAEEDTLAIASHLKSGRPVIVNVKNLDAGNSKRLIDFVCGTAYAFDGKMQKIGPQIFLFTPPNVNILDMQEREMEEELREQPRRKRVAGPIERRPYSVEQMEPDAAYQDYYPQSQFG